MSVNEAVSILVVDDDRPHAEATAESLERAGYAVVVAGSGAEGLEAVERRNYDIVLTDLVMRDATGLDVLRAAKQKSPDAEVVVMTGYASIETCVEAMQDGAANYLPKPINLEMLRTVIEKVVEKQRLARRNRELEIQLNKRYGFEGLVGNSEAMQRVADTIRQISDTTATVLITGESGTGKELVARAIHNLSGRRSHHFVPLNCAALSESLLESELFGHEKGAFTGALAARKGRFEFAHGGTLFLDEVGDLPTATQVKLLRVIEYGEIVRVGANEPVRVNVRLIAATNRSLEELVREKKFREDLYFRLKVVTIRLPPLRERREDIPVLIDHFVRELASAHGRRVGGITPAARKRLLQYDWPGNVRELRNLIESMIVLTKDDTLDVDDIPQYLAPTLAPVKAVGGWEGASVPGSATPPENAPILRRSDPLTLPPSHPPTLSGLTMEAAEMEMIRTTLAATNGNREEAAKRLGIGERTLYRKLKKFDLK